MSQSVAERDEYVAIWVDRFAALSVQELGFTEEEMREMGYFDNRGHGQYRRRDEQAERTRRGHRRE